MVIGMALCSIDFHTDDHLADNRDDASIYSITHFSLNITSIL